MSTAVITISNVLRVQSVRKLFSAMFLFAWTFCFYVLGACFFSLRFFFIFIFCHFYFLYLWKFFTEISIYLWIRISASFSTAGVYIYSVNCAHVAAALTGAASFLFSHYFAIDSAAWFSLSSSLSLFDRVFFGHFFFQTLENIFFICVCLRHHFTIDALSILITLIIDLQLSSFSPKKIVFLYLIFLRPSFVIGEKIIFSKKKYIFVIFGTMEFFFFRCKFGDSQESLEKSSLSWNYQIYLSAYFVTNFRRKKKHFLIFGGRRWQWFDVFRKNVQNFWSYTLNNHLSSVRVGWITWEIASRVGQWCPELFSGL